MMYSNHYQHDEENVPSPFGIFFIISGWVDSCYRHLEFSTGIGMVMEILQATNKYIQSNEPWVLVKRMTKGPVGESSQRDKERLDTLLYVAMESARICALLLQPIMPKSASKMLDMLGVDHGRRGAEHCKFGEGVSGSRLVKAPILFKKVEMNKK